VDDFDTTYSALRDACSPKLPTQLRGLVAVDKFTLPKLPTRRTGRRALAESASSARHNSAATADVAPILTSARARQEALADVSRTARDTMAGTMRGPATVRPPETARPGTFARHPPTVGSSSKAQQHQQQPGSGGGLGSHLSTATQKYLQGLGFDDNPQESSEQKRLRHHGHVVVSRAGAALDAAPSRRVI
jgi:hypothetical protein